MNIDQLQEYRCACGKLLFKGSILVGYVEKKCRHCGRVVLFEGVRNKNTQHLFMADIDDRGIIKSLDEKAHTMFGFAPGELIGKSLFDLFPASEAGNKKELFEADIHHEVSFSMPSQKLVGKNGIEQVCELYFIAKYDAYQKGTVSQVSLLQTHINRILAAQYRQAAGPVDGIFGPLTKQGVERLQITLNNIVKPVPLLVIDGIVGPFTKTAINASCVPQ